MFVEKRFTSAAPLGWDGHKAATDWVCIGSEMKVQARRVQQLPLGAADLLPWKRLVGKVQSAAEATAETGS